MKKRKMGYMRKLIERLLLANYSITIIWYCIVCYFLIFLNSIPLQISSSWHAIVLQISIALYTICFVRRLDLNPEGVFIRGWSIKRVRRLLVAFSAMFLFSMGLSYFMTGEIGENQQLVISYLNQVQIAVFLLHLTIVGLIEELIFRQILFDLSGISWIDVILTSILFSLYHFPDNIWLFISYLVHGLILGTIRTKEGIGSSIYLHWVWNLFVLLLIHT